MKITKARIALNSAANVSSHFLRLFIGIFMTPFLLNRLGAEVYGIMPLVNSCIAFVVLVTGGIQSSVGRYFTLHIARNEPEEANKYASTAFILMLCIVVLLCIPFGFFLNYFPVFFNVPSGQEMESRVVVFLLGLNMIIPLLLSPLTIGLYSQQRFDIKGMLSCISQMIYVLLVVILFNYVSANIIFLAISVVLSGLLSIFLELKFSMQQVPTLRVSWKLFDKKKVRDVFSYSFWIFVNQVTILIFLNTDYIIINKLLGSASVTEYSLATRWNLMIRAVVSSAVGVITPLVTHLEAQDDYHQIRKLLVTWTRFVLILVIPLSVLLTIFSRELIITWVGAEFLNAAPVFWASLLPLVVILAVVPAGAILYGLGRVKAVAIVNLISAIANVILSLLLVIQFNLGILGVAIGSAVALFVKSLFFIPFYTSRVIGGSVILFFCEFVRPLVSMTLLAILALYIQHMFDLTGWFHLFSAGGMCTLVYGVIVYYLVLRDEDKQDTRRLVGKFKHLIMCSPYKKKT